MLTDKYIINFMEKGVSFFNRHITHVNDSVGNPSIIKVLNNKKSVLPYTNIPVTHSCFNINESSERHYLSLYICKVIEKKLYLPIEECKEISDYIVKKKYEEYVKFVMSK